MFNKKQDSELSQSVLEQIMDVMDEHMLSKAMSKKKQPEPEMPSEPEADEDFKVAQPVPMAEEKPQDEEDMDSDMLRQLIEQREQEIA